jgi:hypothetical protein
MRKIMITYSKITPESCEDGDFSETGFINAEGIDFDDTEDSDCIEDTIHFLQREGVFYASSSSFHEGIWYSTEYETIDYRTCEEQQKKLSS